MRLWKSNFKNIFAIEMLKEIGMIKVENLCVKYKKNVKGQPALRSLNLAIDECETLAIMGQSGHGKSTLLAVLGGMLPMNEGNYYFKARNVSEFSNSELAKFRGDEIGFVFQNSFLLPHLTLLENALVPMEHVAMSMEEKKARAISLFKQVGIDELANRFPSEVSGGQAQRAAIARALMRNPSLILADEPTGSLDEISSHQVIEILLSLAKFGATVVIVTHSEKVAERFSRVIQIHNGEIVSDSRQNVQAA